MRLRVLELPTQPEPLREGPSDGALVTYRSGTPSYVLVFDEVDEVDEHNIGAASVEHWQTTTGARGVLLFRSRVDLPGVD